MSDFYPGGLRRQEEPFGVFVLVVGELQWLSVDVGVLEKETKLYLICEGTNLFSTVPPLRTPQSAMDSPFPLPFDVGLTREWQENEASLGLCLSQGWKGKEMKAWSRFGGVSLSLCSWFPGETENPL